MPELTTVPVSYALPQWEGSKVNFFLTALTYTASLQVPRYSVEVTVPIGGSGTVDLFVNGVGVAASAWRVRFPDRTFALFIIPEGLPTPTLSALLELGQDPASAQGTILVDFLQGLFKGAWLVGTQYQKGDEVSHNGSSWSALQPSLGQQPPNDPADVSVYWGLRARAGAAGAAGADGEDGEDGWAPILATVVDGERRVLRVVDWTGGEGAKPPVGQYIGVAGLVENIADGTDIRGSVGSSLQNYVSTAVDYAALVNDNIIAVTVSNKTVTLPTANVSNVGYEYKIDNASPGSIFLVSQGGELIQGEANQIIPPNSCINVYANGTAWRIN